MQLVQAAIVDGLCVQVGDFGDAFSGMTGEAAETELVCKAAKITPENNSQPFCQHVVRSLILFADSRVHDMVPSIPSQIPKTVGNTYLCHLILMRCNDVDPDPFLYEFKLLEQLPARSFGSYERQR